MYTASGWTHLLEGPLAMEKLGESVNTLQDGEFYNPGLVGNCENRGH